MKHNSFFLTQANIFPTHRLFQFFFNLAIKQAIKGWKVEHFIITAVCDVWDYCYYRNQRFVSNKIWKRLRLIYKTRFVSNKYISVLTCFERGKAKCCQFIQCCPLKLKSMWNSLMTLEHIKKWKAIHSIYTVWNKESDVLLYRVIQQKSEIHCNDSIMIIYLSAISSIETEN